MKQIKAIQTMYKGYKFRSRLEARWAVFFDALGIKYKYEEYGFENEHYKWLPDFYLPDTCTWVEVKGGTPSADDCWKMAWLLDYSSPLPFITDSGYEYRLTDEERSLRSEMGGDGRGFGPVVNGLLLLGEIPNVNHGVTLHPIIKHRKGLIRKYAKFYGTGLRNVTDEAVGMFNNFYSERIPTDDYIDGGGDGGSSTGIEFFTPYSHYCSSYFANKRVCDAYKKARSARFEHGETPI